MPRLHSPSMFGKPTLLALALFACCQTAQAEEATPQQAQALPEPAMAKPVEASFQLQAVEFVGANAIPDSELQHLAADMLGKTVTFSDLQRLVERVNAEYRRRGLMLAQAVLPVQEVTDGRIKISISEGAIGTLNIEVDPAAPISKERVARTLELVSPGKALNGRNYERAMLLLSDLPGIRPQSVMTPAASGGGTDIAVQVGPRQRMQYSLQLDDYGTRDSGRIRLTGSARMASPTGRGDNLDLRVMLAQGLHTGFGRLSYETPIGYQGLRFGVGVGRVQYQLAGPLSALKPEGVANVADLSLNYPFIRQRSTNVFLRAVADYKDLNDQFKSVGFETRKRVQGVGLGVSLENRDKLLGGGYTSANATLYRGRLTILDPITRLYDTPPWGYGTHGDFTKFSLQAARLQYLAPKLSLYLSGGLQRANRNLDSYEKLSLGGPTAVRAYPTGEVLVDDGWIASTELRFALKPNLTVSAFYDAGNGQLFHRMRAIDPVSRRSLRGYGVGLNWAMPAKFVMNASIAWRDGTGIARADTDRNPRLYWSIQRTF